MRLQVAHCAQESETPQMVRIGFHIGDIEVVVFDSEPQIDCSELDDQEICDLINPCLSEEVPWYPLSQAAYEEACERDMIDYSGMNFL